MENENYMIKAMEIKQEYEETIEVEIECNSKSTLLNECKEIFHKLESYEDQIIKEELAIEQVVTPETSKRKELVEKDEYGKCVEIKREYEVHVEVETDNPSDSKIKASKEKLLKPELYQDHIIKEELVIGPEVILETNKSTVTDPKKTPEWVCNLCNKGYITKGALTKHTNYYCPMNPNKIIAKGSIVNWYSCYFCNKSYKRKNDLVYHLKMHNDSPAKYNCECGKVYATRNALRHHMYVKHLNNTNNRVCLYCNKDLNDKTYRDYHMKNVCPMNQNIVRPPVENCNYCDMKFTDEAFRKRHIKYACPKNPNKIELTNSKVLCNYCNMIFYGTKKRDHHIKHFCSMNENKTVLKNTVCEFCNQSFSSQVKRNYHTKHVCNMNPNKIVLEHKKTVLCKLCKKAFGSKTSRDRHVNSSACAMKKNQ